VGIRQPGTGHRDVRDVVFLHRVAQEFAADLAAVEDTIRSAMPMSSGNSDEIRMMAAPRSAASCIKR
jgi:hypothetical protein